jgi:hypothetical protein
VNDGHRAHIRNLDGAAHRLDLWDLADEPHGFFVECHISKHARQCDLTVRRGVQGDSPAIGRAHAKKTPAPERLLGLSLNTRDLLAGELRNAWSHR